MEYNIYQKKSNSPFIVILLPLLLFCPFCVFGQIAKVNKVWLEHGTLKNGDKGITIHADINVNGMKGKEIKAIAYFYDGDKNKLMGGVSGYKTKNGQVCAADYGTPSYDKSHYKDFNIFIPYESLPLLSGKRTYYISLRIQDNNSHNFISEKSNYVSFIGTGKNKKSNRNDGSNRNDNSNIRTKRVEKQNGYEEWTYYDNGTSKCVTVEICFICHGSGICTICNGTGGTYNSYTHLYYPCKGCFQTLRCKHCDGKGKSTLVTQINSDGSTFSVGSGGYVGTTNGSGTLGGSRYSSGSSHGESSGSSSSSNCSYCSGSGVCSRCHGKGGEYKDTGYYIGERSLSWISCSSCNGNGRCSICRGKGKM